MNIAIASDHAGFPIKKVLVEYARSLGYKVLDLGTNSTRPVDYPDYAEKLGQVIQDGKVVRGILLCGSGVGACIAANKLKGIYASVCHDTFGAHQGVEHDDMNVLCLGANIIGTDLAKELVATFLAARFRGQEPGQERHAMRVKKIKMLEDR